MKNCVIYVRTNNKDDYSIKNQEELLKSYLNDKLYSFDL